MRFVAAVVGRCGGHDLKTLTTYFVPLALNAALLAASIGAQAQPAEFQNLIGDWVQGAPGTGPHRIGVHGDHVSQSDAPRARMAAAAATEAGGNFGFEGIDNQGEEYRCVYYITFLPNDEAYWRVILHTGEFGCPEGRYRRVAKPRVVGGGPESILPQFPSPPPAASASYGLPRNFFASQATVGAVVEAIIAALDHTGYVERSFFRTEAAGVALVTRLERINEDGSPRGERERWPGILQEHYSSLDLIGFLRGLFYVDPGRYRVIVFILQELPFSQSSDRISGDDARAWLRIGATGLPREVAERPFGGGNCTVLVYEFASDGTAVRAVESPLTGKQHLEKAGVLAILAKAN